MFRKRIFLISLISVISFVLLGGTFFSGFILGTKNLQVLIIKGVSNIEPEKPVGADFNTFWQTWQIIDESYLRSKEVSPQDKVYGAIGGLVKSLGDPYSAFFSPNNSKKFQEDIRGSFGGIGVEIGIKKDKLVVIAPLKNTPAYDAGLLPGDQILTINSTSTEDLTIEQAVSFIRGPENTQVTLSILRDTWESSRDFKITRTRISLPTLDFEMKDDKIAYIQIHSFNENVERLFANAVSEALSKDVKGIVLDLRNNPGGFLGVAINMAGWFLPRGSLVVSEAYPGGLKDDFKASGNSLLAKLPVVVLENGGTASASEILAGALRFHRKIKIVGEKSFGKGTIQEIKQLRDGSSLKITVAHWVLPGGEVLEGSGLKPDIEAKLTEEDAKNKRDPQLDKALEILKTEIARGE
ncbi:MAG: S41 family peptidase [Candidatus Liptonbacteria bacterium]|nr:S41 family peptidase [Candidatus Liptonbacteria bacterium]